MSRPLVTLALLVVGCGSSRPPAIVTTPFTEEHAEVFEDGVDFVGDPEVLEGRWREEWSRDLDRRVSYSDVIAVVDIHTIRTDTDLDRTNTVRLVATLGRELYGTAPEEELTLPIREGETGFGTVEGNERRILDSLFVMFVKWYTNERGAIAPHWHLAPATSAVVSRVEYLIERRHDVPREDRGRVIVHEN